MSATQTEARTATGADRRTHESQRHGIQAAIESVQDVLDGWPFNADALDAYESVWKARESLWKAKSELEAKP